MIKPLNKKGFTIMELIIASTVFSTMMLLATTGILQIGKIYYKGMATQRTQETTRAILDDVTRNYQISPVALPDNDTAGVLCIGQLRYNYRIGVKLDDTNPHMLWTDRIISGGTCAPLNMTQAVPSDANTDMTDLGKSAQQELIPKNMRLSKFDIATSNGGMSVNVQVVYGDLDLTPDLANPECIPISQGGQFCAVAQLSTFVKKR